MTLREFCSQFDDEDLEVEVEVEVVVNIPDSSGSYTQKGKKIISVEKKYKYKNIPQEDGAIAKVIEPKESKIVLTTTLSHQLGGVY